MGDRIPADHCYRLYSALVERIPALKEMNWQLSTITGIPDRQGWVKLGRRSRLMIRCSLDQVPAFSTLDGTILRVGQTLLQLGTLEGNNLTACETLESRLVI
jgi:CRISPR-associated protein Cas6